MTGKFYKLPMELVSRADLQASDKLVYAVLESRIGSNGKCWPGLGTLAKDTGLGRRTVLRAIQRMEKFKLISVDRQGRGRVNFYRTSVKMALLSKFNQCQNGTTGSAKKSLKVVPKSHSNKNKNKINEKKTSQFIPPTEEEVLYYAESRGFPGFDAKAFIDYYEAGAWHDSKGNPVRNWKQKLLAVWLKNNGKPKRQLQRGEPDWLPTEKELDEIYAQC